jgi:hypothetical protein
MNLSFIGGSASTFAFLALWFFLVNPKIKMSTIVKLINILTETAKSKKSMEMSLSEDEHILTVTDGEKTLLLPSFPVTHLYDVICYKDAEHEEELPITFFRYKNRYAYIPFQPKDYGLTKVYLGVKYLTKDDYVFLKYEERDFVDISSAMYFYENSSHLVENQEELAEAFD